MNTYRLPIIQPKLSRNEQLACQLISNLHAAQMHHKFHDPNFPPGPSGWKFLWRPRAAREQMLATLREYCLTCRFQEPRDSLSLIELWPMINPPGRLTPRRVEQDDLYFEHFVVSQRFADSRTWCIVFAPTSEDPCRSLVREAFSGWFCSTSFMSNREPPAPNDFVLVKVPSTAFHRRSRTKIETPEEIDVYLPRCYAPWNIVSSNDEHW